MADAAATSAVELNNVSAGYGETVVLEDINLKVAPGESISVIGRNGVGKTTLLATVMGHTTLHKGEVVFDGLPHAFWAYMAAPESDQANELVARFLKDRLAAAAK